jgi:hypothetical protein
MGHTRDTRAHKGTGTFDNVLGSGQGRRDTQNLVHTGHNRVPVTFTPGGAGSGERPARLDVDVPVHCTGTYNWVRR